MRSGKNALQTIEAVKVKLEELQASLPAGVEIVPIYDRSGLIERAVENLSQKLIEEFLVVAVVCAVFLFHLRSAFVAIVSLPLGILMAFIVMHYQGVNANIMSLGGIAIAIGAMVDAAVVMIENAHKHLERWAHEHPDQKLEGEARWRVIGDAAVEVGPALFFSLLIITLSLHPGVHAAKRRKGGCSRRWPSPRPTRWRRGGARGHADPGADGLPDPRPHPGREGATRSTALLIALYRPLLDGVLRGAQADARRGGVGAAV